MKKHSYKEIERQRREEDILHVAERLLLERGYGNLNMDELADAVGISKPTLYAHFSGKDAIAVRVLMRSYRHMDEFLSQPVDEPAIDRLRAFIRRSLVIHGPGSVMASMRGEMGPQIVRRLMHDESYLAAYKQEFFQKLHKLVDTAKEEGDIDSSIPTSVVTHILLALNRSLADPTLQAEIASNPNRLDSAIESVIRVFLYGVTPTNSQESLVNDKEEKLSSPAE